MDNELEQYKHTGEEFSVFSKWIPATFSAPSHSIK